MARKLIGNINQQTSSTSMGEVGNSGSQLENELKRAALADPKNVARYQGLINMLIPPKDDPMKQLSSTLGILSQAKGLGAIPSLTAGQETSLGGYKTLLSDLQRAQTSLAPQAEGNVLKNIPLIGQWLSDLTTGATGPLSAKMGAYGESGPARQALDTLRAQYEKGFYGSALTESEIKRGKKWLIGSDVQETPNITRLTELTKTKQNQMRDLLLSAGYSPQEAEQYITTGELPRRINLQDLFKQAGFNVNIQPGGQSGGSDWEIVSP